MIISCSNLLICRTKERAFACNRAGNWVEGLRVVSKGKPINLRSFSPRSDPLLFSFFTDEGMEESPIIIYADNH